MYCKGEFEDGLMLCSVCILWSIWVLCYMIEGISGFVEKNKLFLNCYLGCVNIEINLGKKCFGCNIS